MRFLMLYYRIPSKSGVRNPSDDLRRRGVRVDGSVWIVPDGRLPEETIQRLRSGGCVCDVVRYDEKEYDKVRLLARGAIEEECRRIRTSLEEQISQMRLREKRAESEEEQAKASDYVKSCFRAAAKYLNAAEEAAIAFDLLAEVKEAIKAQGAFVAASREEFFAKHAEGERACTSESSQA